MEIELLKYLKGKYKNVSYERIVSGQGLVDIFNFLKDMDYDKIEKDVLRKFESEDSAAVISKAALSKKCKVCVKALDIFVSVLGAQAGNMVLNLVATGGVYLGGGIPPKIKDKLIDGTFIKSYLDKEPVGYLVKSTSVHLIKDELAALNGATYMALSL
jgi:glucokinase